MLAQTSTDLHGQRILTRPATPTAAPTGDAARRPAGLHAVAADGTTTDRHPRARTSRTDLACGGADRPVPATLLPARPRRRHAPPHTDHRSDRRPVAVARARPTGAGGAGVPRPALHQ